jgi:RNA polymerase primary sigma factor
MRDATPDALTQFIRELNTYPVLSPEQHLALIEKAQAGDQDAMNTMVTHNMRLVIAIATRSAGQGVPLMDLIQEGSFGVRRAVEKFDATKGFQFSTYATPWIQQAVGRTIEDMSRTIRIPSYKHQQVRKIKRDLAHDDVARAIALAEAQAEWEVVSLDRELHPDDPYDETTLADLIPSSNLRMNVEHIANQQLLLSLFARAKLTKRERAVIIYHYGLDGKGARTLEATGALIITAIGKKRMGITRERVRQIEANALRKLRLAATHSRDRDALLALVA